MFLKDWMSSPAVTVNKDEFLPKVIELMKENDIRHVPVMDGDKLVGIISDRNIKDYLPSSSTTLDVFEIHYLIGKVKVSKIMEKNVITAAPYTPIEDAAKLLYDNKISSLPIIDDGLIVGIVTDRDVYRALISITGVESKEAGYRVYCEIEDRPGTIREVADIVRSHGFGIESILSSHTLTESGKRKIVIRTRGKGDFEKMEDAVRKEHPDAMIT